MLKRINKGASNVDDITGRTLQPDPSAAAAAPEGASERLIFRGRVLFALKDAPDDHTDQRKIIKEFKKQLSHAVNQGENFVEALYGGKASFTAYPGLSPEFYRTLKEVRSTSFYIFVLFRNCSLATSA